MDTHSKHPTDPALIGDALLGFSVPEADLVGGQECVLDRGRYNLRLANTSGQRSKASLLIQRRYSWRGYHTGAARTVSNDANRITLEASCGSHLVGTLTLGLDSDEGLLADTLYGEQVARFRRGGAKVCELSQLAIDPQYSSKEVLASLFHLAYIYGRIVHRVTDAFIEVNPRHAGYYRNMLGFQQIGEPRICERVNAPAVLLHLEVDYMDGQIAKYGGGKNSPGGIPGGIPGGSPGGSSGGSSGDNPGGNPCENTESGSVPRSLYPYFFSKVEEEGLSRRILETHQGSMRGQQK